MTGNNSILGRTVSKLVLAIVFVLTGSSNLLATDYLFGITYDGTRYFLAVPSNPGSSGTCELIEITDSNTLQRCLWHCVSSKGGTTPSNILSSGSTGSYLYVGIGGTKYWLRTADGSDPIRYNTDSDNSYDFIFNGTGLAENSSTKYYVYRNSSGKPCTSSSTSGNLLTIGSYACVIASPTGFGKVYVKGDGAYSGEINLDTDFAVRTAGKSGTTYYINALALYGYYFKGWSKTNSYTSIDVAASSKSGKNQKDILFNESNGYAHTYYAMYVPYWKFKATGEATNAGGGTVSATVAQSEVEASDGSSTTGSTTATFTATANTGYEFLGWTDTKSGTTVTQGSQNPKTGVNITNSTPGSTATKTLYAIFKPLTYTVSFINTNPNATGTMDDVVFTFGQDQKLPKNKFIHEFTTTFDANDNGTIDGQPTKTITSSAFSRWIDQNGTYYNDEEVINKTGISELKLTAVWHKDSDDSYKAPFKPSVPVKGDRVCTGWHWKRYVVNKVADAGVLFWMYASGKTLFAQYGDPFYAKVTLSKTSGTSGSPSADVTEKESNFKNDDLIFTITAPAASDGYHFTKWTGTNVTFDDATKQTGAKATVKSSNTAGSANATVATITANYESNVYSIKINANGISEDKSIVFNVTGPSVTHRISVPVGGSKTLYNLPIGTYSINLEGSWSWSSNVSPTSKSITFDSSGGSQLKTADFTVTYRSSIKKNDEKYNTIGF